MRQLAELQKRAATAVKYQDLIAIALYAHSPSEAYRVAVDFDWYDKKAASCRFLSMILRDFGIEIFQDFVERKNPEAHRELCWCECHREAGHDYFSYAHEDCECSCCAHVECLQAAHTFGYECEKCEAQEGDSEDDGESRCDNCHGDACSECPCWECREDMCNSYRDGDCAGDACDNCKCNGCEGPRQEEEITIITERRREESEAVPEPVALPPGRVGRIAQRLFKVTGKSYAVGVFESNNSPTAWATGDAIGISTGALNRYDDDELAIIMSHELAHNLREHPQEAYQRTISMLQGVSRVTSSEGIFWAIAYGALNHAINRQADRESELDADKAAVEIARRAGFDSSKAARVFGRFQSSGGLFSTHPSAERRVKNIS